MGSLSRVEVIPPRRRELVLGAVCACLILGVFASSVARAQEAPVAEDSPAEEPGRVAFQAGVDAAQAEDWEVAARHFERAFEEAPRVAVAFNLVVAYEHLDRPVALVEMADRMLAMADAVRHETQRTQVLALRERAIQRIVELRLRVVPSDASVRVDGQDRPGAGPTRTLWLEPGPHEVRVSAPEHADAALTVEGGAGDRVERQVRLDPVADEDDAQAGEGSVSTEEVEPSRRAEGGENAGRDLGANPPAPGGATAPSSGVREVLGLSLGGLGALGLGAAVVLQVGATVQAHDLEGDDPRQAGFLSATETYRRWRAAGIALSLGGGLAAAAAVVLTDWRLPEWARWWTLAAGAVLTVGGTVLALRTPGRIGETTLTHPDRALGALLIGLGTPLVVAPLVGFADPGNDTTTSLAPGGAGIALRGVWP